MPLEYDNEPGSWGRASLYWPTYVCTDEEHAQRVFVACTKEGVVPYGSYVRSGLDIRIETPELLNKLTLHMMKTPYKTAQKVIDLYEAGELPLKCYSAYFGFGGSILLENWFRKDAIARLKARQAEL